MGLAGMIGEMVMRCDRTSAPMAPSLEALHGHPNQAWRALAN